MITMTQDRIETFQVSVSAVPPGFSSLFRQRLRDLGFGSEVDRERLGELCGSASAANQFLAKASNMGALVPTDWGRYVVASKETIRLIARIGHPAYRRFVSWQRHLPEIVEEGILFAAPYLWRETELNVERPMPVIGLDPEQDTLEGHPPQWDVFYMDLDETRDWELVLDGETVDTFQTPGPVGVVILLRASLDPRWRQAATVFPQNQGANSLAEEINTLHLAEAPRGRSSVSLGAGPPHRRRLRAPPWYVEKVDERARRNAFEEALGDA
jgi:hypothetical protein